MTNIRKSPIVNTIKRNKIKSVALAMAACFASGMLVEYDMGSGLRDTITVTSIYSVTDSTVIRKIPNITLTAYTNRVEETDSSPNLTATDRAVNTGLIAVSQDLWRKKIFPGDRVCVTAIDKCFIADDTMNARYTKRMDIFMFDYNKAKRFKITSSVTVYHTEG